MASVDARTLVYVSGLVTYLIYKCYEPTSLLATFILLLLFPACLATAVQSQYSSILIALPAVFGSYWFTITALIVGYRVSPLHPLASIPGPVVCKISKLWFAYKVFEGKGHRYLLQLHAQYGDVVRLGPNELSIRHEDAVNPVLRDSLKGPYFKTRQNGAITQLDGCWEDLVAYSQRRKPWNRGMSTAAFKDYEDILRTLIRDLLASLEKRQGEPINIAEWMLYTAFDFTGEMSLSKHFNCVKTGSDASGLIHAVQESVDQVAWVAHIPWTLPFLVGLSKVVEDKGSWRAFQTAGTQIVRERLAAGSTKRDLFHYLSNEDGLEAERPPLELVASDGALAIIAGSDTAATALSQTFYFLLRHPECMKKLRGEIESVYPGSTDPLLDFGKQAEMPYLNACINEALRLHPPVLEGVQRRLQSGTIVGSHYIPEGTIVTVNNLAMQRDARYFYPLPETYWPDRWLTQDTYTLPTGGVIPKSKLTHNRNVFVPFSLGLRSCVGKNVAWLEMRAILCALVQKFDITRVPEYDLDDWEKSMRAVFITAYGPLMGQFKARY